VIVFGLILVLLGVGAGVLLFLGTESIARPVDLDTMGIQVSMTPLALLVAGAVVMLLLWFGLGMIRGSAKRRRRPVREAKEAERQAKIEESIRADERARAEETHQSALVERDRVRDEEFQTRLADRDRERDSELASREQEFVAREQAAEQRARENEERVRADERLKVEQEHATRDTAVGAGSATASATSPTADADLASERPSSEADTDRVTAERPDTGGVRDDDGSGTADSDGSSEEPRDPEARADADPSHPGYRTVADKIMGRGPSDHD
jgi:membrane protein involved in colicin uptake